MGRIIVTEFISLDGVVEDPGGAEGFQHGGWVFAINRGAEGDRFKLEETLDTEALLLGRTTYEQFVKAWPSRTGEFADKFNALPKFVVSSTLKAPEWNATVLSGDAIRAVSKLKQELRGDIVVHGSIRLARALIEHDLVDELRLMVYPVALGAGMRFFGPTSEKKHMRLVHSQPVGDGIVILTYAFSPDAEPKGDHESRRKTALSRAGIQERGSSAAEAE